MTTDELPWWPAAEKLAAKAEDMGVTPGWGRSPGGENGNLFQYSFLGNPRDRGVWWATIHGVAKSQTRLSD